ncbi:MAG: hypothetical protein CM15mP120_06100 [Pseudomonadota bacterium]|nr:MAG: hypothetical protein CM15mP120_06100 [Pseudomonadota bacterium]
MLARALLPLRAHYHAMVERMNQSTGAVLALDIPSGVADTGAATVVDGKLLAVRADVQLFSVGRPENRFAYRCGAPVLLAINISSTWAFPMSF